MRATHVVLDLDLASTGTAVLVRMKYDWDPTGTGTCRMKYDWDPTGTGTGTGTAVQLSCTRSSTGIMNRFVPVIGQA